MINHICIIGFYAMSQLYMLIILAPPLYLKYMAHLIELCYVLYLVYGHTAIH